MEEPQTASEGAQVQVPKGKQSAKAKEDVILSGAQTVEALTKEKALSLAARLSNDIEGNSFVLGGCLKRIYENSWFEGFETFEQFVADRFGFGMRTAKYMMAIYTNLVEKQIPWEKVAKLGWTKIKELAPIITADNVDAWVAKAENLTVIQLQAAIAATKTPGADGEKPTKTSDEIVKMTFKFHKDQSETVVTAISKAKAEISTDVDTVALNAICIGYLGGGSHAVGDEALKAKMKAMGWQSALGLAAEVFEDEIDIEATKKASA